MKSLFFAIVAIGLCLGALSVRSFAAELDGVKLPDDVTVDGKKLPLNCLGLRKVTKFGFPVKVYVAGLYLEKKSSDSDEILKSDDTKVILMHFVRGLDRDQLIEAFQSGIENGCYIDCDKRNAQWSLLSPLVVSVRQNNELKFTFYKDKLGYDVNGPNEKHAVASEPAATALSHNLLSMFINKKKPPTEEFRKGLLCIK
jgi:Chalcone isomerase-like